MYTKKVELPDNPPQPNLEGEHPEIWKSAIVDGITYVGGKGRVSADCMVLMPCLYEEDARDGVLGAYNKILKDPPAFLKCQAGAAIKDLINSYGIEGSNIYATAIIKWLLPKERRNRPTKEELNFGFQFFAKEIEKIKPKLVLCLGKAAFDFLSPYTLKADDILGGVFWSKEYSCYYTLLDPIQVLQNKPFEIEKYKICMKESITLLKETYGISRNAVELNYKVIYNSNELKEVVDYLYNNQFNLISIDCEWGGLNPWKGNLRSMQMAWAPGQACYIRFMDDKGNYTFDVGYEEVGNILRKQLDRPEVKFVGHHFAADGVWMEQVLKIDTYQKCYLDTEFASQTVNEHRELGLESIAMRYTDLGRYEMDLILWKKSNPQKDTDGYAFIPDEIMFPYAMKDVDCVIRAVPFLVEELKEQNLTAYYFNYFNKFVTDVFIHFTTTGLLIDVDKLQELRELYGFCKERLEHKFVELMATDAENIMREFLASTNLPFEDALKLPKEVIAELKGETVERVSALLKHYDHREHFNFRSGDDMRRWLFDVKQFKPFKSTPQKDKGRPSTSWDKVLQMPAEQQKLYTPSADKQTLNIYADQDPLVARLVGLNLVGNIFKMCLKPAELDDEGNVVKENGLFFFIDSGGYIRCNFSATETSRPRSWKPNILNLSSFVNKRISKDITEILHIYREKGELPEKLEKYLTVPIPSIRSCIKSPEGCCMVESDYATAEIRALAFISGDINLIRLMTEKDDQFGLVMVEDEAVSVRLKYDENCGIPVPNQREEFIMHIAKNNEIIRKVEYSELMRDACCNIIHPAHDLHWSLVEFMYEVPRESLDKKMHRDGMGKVGNFSCLPASTRVLTQFGEIPILELNSDLHKLWDGINWVSYDGIIQKGKQEVFEYQGLRATADHGVWLDDGREVYFGEAITHSLNLSKTMGTDSQPKLAEFYSNRGDYADGQKTAYFISRKLSKMWKKLCEMAVQCRKRIRARLSMSEKKESDYTYFKNSLPQHGSAVSTVDTCKFPQLQRKEYQSAISHLSKFCKLGRIYISGGDIQWERFRPDRQRRTLLSRKLKVGNPTGKLKKHKSIQGIEFGESENIAHILSGNGFEYTHYTELDPSRQGPRGYIQRLESRKTEIFSAPQKRESGKKEELISKLIQLGYSYTLEPVYDLVNAGPNRRYTANGVLVSNTAYGATPSTLERKIYADSGVPPEPGTGDKIFKALENRQGRAVEFLEEMQLIPAMYPHITAASGKRRHFLGTNDKTLGFKERKNLMSSQGREARNFLMQESVGATAMRACIWLIEAYKALGMKARVMICLYDALVTVCPLEERHLVAQLHQLYMAENNEWEYNERKMYYPIDTEFVFRWTDKRRSEHEQKLLGII